MALTTLNAVAKKRLQGFQACITDFSNEINPIRNGKPVNAQISISTACGEVKTDPTSFESIGDTIEAREVEMHLQSAQFGIDWNSGIQIEQCFKINANKLCDKLIAVWSALITTTNFGASNDFDIAGAVTADAKDELFQKIFALLDVGSSKFLVANSALYSKGAPINQMSFDPTSGGGRVRGFDGFFENAYLNTGDVHGFVTDGTALAVVSRLPEWSPLVASKLDSSQNITIEELGLTVQLNLWGSTGNRAAYGTFDVVFGAGFYDKTALKIVGQTA